MSNRDLIGRLKRARTYSADGLADMAPDLFQEAITALEAHEWHPIAAMPDELKDGRKVHGFGDGAKQIERKK